MNKKKQIEINEIVFHIHIGRTGSILFVLWKTQFNAHHLTKAP